MILASQAPCCIHALVDARRRRRVGGMPRARREEVIGVVKSRWFEEFTLAYSHATNEGIEQPLPALPECEASLR